MQNCHAAANLNGILFAEDFDDEPMVQAGQNGDLPTDTVLSAEPSMAAPQFFAEDLAAARHEGFSAGRDAGLADTKHHFEKATLDACASIAGALERDAAAGLLLIDQSIASVTCLLIDTLAAMLPATCAHNQAREIAAVVRELVADMTGETVMQINVAHALCDELKSALLPLPAHLARRVVLRPKDDVAEGDALLSWGQGTASFSAGRARRAVMEILGVLQLIQVDPDPASAAIRKTDILSAMAIEQGERINA
jgi:hypothetical protein